jgi:hypothetical protein
VNFLRNANFHVCNNPLPERPRPTRSGFFLDRISTVKP